MRVVIAGGGTAGHVTLGLAVAERLARIGNEVTFVRTSNVPEAWVVPASSR